MSAADEIAEIEARLRVRRDARDAKYFSVAMKPPHALPRMPWKDDDPARFRRMREQLARVSYKPTVTLSLRETEDGVLLLLVAQTEDSRSPGRWPLEVAFPTVIPWGDPVIGDDDFFLDFVRLHIANWEAHESDEWLRIDGRLVRDPHAGK